jgi:hypothetical protein
MTYEARPSNMLFDDRILVILMLILNQVVLWCFCLLVVVRNSHLRHKLSVCLD